MKKNKMWIYIFLLPSVLIFLLFYLMPILTILYTSFTKWDGFTAPAFVGLKNYMRLFTSDVFLISLKNLFWWSVIAAILHVGFGVLVAFLLYKKPLGWKFVRSVFMIPNVISVAAWAIIYRFVFNNDYGILNGIVRLFYENFNVQWFYESPHAFIAITFTWLFYAVYVTLIVLTDLMAIPKELHEAAVIDGATPMEIIRYIDFPLIRNAVGTGVILSITSRIAMYEQIALTSRGGPGDDTANIPLILVKAITDMKYGYGNAAAVIMIGFGIMTLILINKLFKMKERIY